MLSIWGPGTVIFVTSILRGAFVLQLGGLQLFAVAAIKDDKIKLQNGFRGKTSVYKSGY